MTTPEPNPDFLSRTRGHLRDIVTDAAGQPPLFIPQEMREVGPNSIADLRIRWRCHPRLTEPDECERAILELLYLRGRTRYRDVVAQLDNEFSESTLRRRLKRLNRLGVIRLSRQAPRGYELTPFTRSLGDSGAA